MVRALVLDFAPAQQQRRRRLPGGGGRRGGRPPPKASVQLTRPHDHDVGGASIARVPGGGGESQQPGQEGRTRLRAGSPAGRPMAFNWPAQVSLGRTGELWPNGTARIAAYPRDSYTRVAVTYVDSSGPQKGGIPAKQTIQTCPEPLLGLQALKICTEAQYSNQNVTAAAAAAPAARPARRPAAALLCAAGRGLGVVPPPWMLPSLATGAGRARNAPQFWSSQAVAAASHPGTATGSSATKALGQPGGNSCGDEHGGERREDQSSCYRTRLLESTDACLLRRIPGPHRPRQPHRQQGRTQLGAHRPLGGRLGCRSLHADSQADVVRLQVGPAGRDCSLALHGAGACRQGGRAAGGGGVGVVAAGSQAMLSRAQHLSACTIRRLGCRASLASKGTHLIRRCSRVLAERRVAARLSACTTLVAARPAPRTHRTRLPAAGRACRGSLAALRGVHNAAACLSTTSKSRSR